MKKLSSREEIELRHKNRVARLKRDKKILEKARSAAAAEDKERFDREARLRVELHEDYVLGTLREAIDISMGRRPSASGETVLQLSNALRGVDMAGKRLRLWSELHEHNHSGEVTLRSIMDDICARNSGLPVGGDPDQE